MEVQELRIDEIKADFETYAYRDELKEETVKEYQQIVDDLPPVDVFKTEEGLILAGGYHRLEAHRQERRETITANIHQGTVFEAKMFACKANAQHGLNMTTSERKRALMDFIKFSLAEDPLLSNVVIARNFGGTSEKTVRRYRTKLEESEEIDVSTQRRGADGRVIEAIDIGSATSASAEVNLIETIPVAEVEPESVVEFAGKRINTLDDLMKVKTPDQELMDQFFELDLAVIKVRKLVTKLSAYPRPKIMSVLYGRDEITRTLSYQATSLGESAQFYRELSNGGKSESEAQIIEPTEADEDGQQLSLPGTDESGQTMINM